MDRRGEASAGGHPPTSGPHPPSRRGRARRAASGQPLACVLGGLDIVSPLGREGIACAVAVGPHDPSRWSKHVVAAIDAPADGTAPDGLVARLVDWARTLPAKPVLFYPTDATLLLVSRSRDELGSAFRTVLPAADLVEALTDKARFADLAARTGLPVPRSVALPAGRDARLPADLRYPLVLKPAVHRHGQPFRSPGKAVSVSGPAELDALLREAPPDGPGLIAQELVPGAEARIESYHAYVDADGVVADFTGRKSHTYPATFGETALLSITDTADVRADGRRTVERLGLTGVCKIDYKRGEDGRLWLLEINARFNLWHNAGAAAGVNLPALVYADLVGRRRPPVDRLRAGTTWVDPVLLSRGILRRELPVRAWPAAVTATTRSTGDWDDALPFLRGMLAPRLRGARRRAVDRGSRG